MPSRIHAANAARRRFAAVFAHNLALPQPGMIGKKSCKHDFLPIIPGWLNCYNKFRFLSKNTTQLSKKVV